jgi:hypothetical protein
MQKRIAVLILALFLVGCQNVSKTLASWVGHNMTELIASWGPPSQTFADGKGGQVFVYKYSRSWVQPGQATTSYSATTSSGYTSGQATTVYSPSYVQGYDAYRMFYVNGDGVIYSWAWRGL